MYIATQLLRSVYSVPRESYKYLTTMTPYTLNSEYIFQSYYKIPCLCLEALNILFHTLKKRR
jgi:hypothetical protein